MHPLVNGDYPEVMKQRLAMLSSNEGRNNSRLPEFTDSQKVMIKGTIDFIAVNHFNTWYVADSNITLAPFVGVQCPGETAPVPETALPQVATDSGVFKMHDWSWQDTGNDDIKVTPWGIRRLLEWIQNDYGDYPIVVSGNGYSEPMFYTKYAVHNWFMPNAVINPGERPRDVGLEDTERVHYMNLYINEVLKAIEVDHVNVMGYFASSLMDGFEWSSGYTERYGMFRTNFTDFTRQPKESAQYYAQTISSHAAYHGKFDLHCDQYRQSTDMCHIRKAWFCDYASWRVKFFSTWLNMFLQYRDNSCDSHHFEVPE
jgi:lactase-phlorizin hydrolase